MTDGIRHTKQFKDLKTPSGVITSQSVCSKVLKGKPASGDAMSDSDWPLLPVG
jgi:hypothetical protein